MIRIKTKLFSAFLTGAIAISLTACFQVNTGDAREAWEYWAGAQPPENIKLFKGSYWQSPHFTKEYILYLKFHSDEKWWKEFKQLNSLVADSLEWNRPGDAPEWFRPGDNFTRYKKDDDFDQGSVYFRDSVSGTSYLYEIQL